MSTASYKRCRQPAWHAPCPRRLAGRGNPGRHPNVQGSPCRPLRRTCLPLDGGPDSPTPGRSRPLAPPARQPTAKSGPSTPGQPMDASRSGSAEGRKPSIGLCLCHFRPAQGRWTSHCTDYPPPSPWWPRPILHQPGRRQRRLPRRRRHRPPSHAHWAWGLSAIRQTQRRAAPDPVGLPTRWGLHSVAARVSGGEPGNYRCSTARVFDVQVAVHCNANSRSMQEDSDSDNLPQRISLPLRSCLSIPFKRSVRGTAILE
jgi:hypothetical protein